MLAGADMDQRFAGNYIKAGTRAIIEDTGTDLDTGSDVAAGTNRSLIFDPLRSGPGASGLAMAYVFLSPSLDIEDANAIMLSPEFAASSSALLSDETRRYTVFSWLNLDDYRYVIIYDYFLEQMISVGELQPGPGLTDQDAGMIDTALSDAAGFDTAAADAQGDDHASEDRPTIDAAQSADAAFQDAVYQDRPSEDQLSEDAGEPDGGSLDAPAADTTVEDGSLRDRETQDQLYEDVNNEDT